jgi:hypothetical protein
MKIFLVAFITCGIYYPMFSITTTQKTDTIYIYTLDNMYFTSILDSFILHESQYDYYDSTCAFNMNINKFEIGGLWIWLGSGYYHRVYANIEKYLRESIPKITHILVYKSHNFFITSLDELDTALFKKTNLYYIIPEEQELVVDIFELIGDESKYETAWLYWYQNGEFHEYEKWARNYGKKK